jgi:hypothetical protein
MRSAFEEVALKLPRKVPLALPLLMAFGPRVRSAAEAEALGVEETMKLPDCVSAVPEIVSVEVPLNPPVVFDQNGKLFAEIAELVDTDPPPPQVEVERTPVIPTVTHGFPEEPSNESATAPLWDTVKILLEVATVSSIVLVAGLEVPRKRFALLSKPARRTLDEE